MYFVILSYSPTVYTVFRLQFSVGIRKMRIAHSLSTVMPPMYSCDHKHAICVLRCKFAVHAYSSFLSV